MLYIKRKERNKNDIGVIRGVHQTHQLDKINLSQHLRLVFVDLI